MTFYHVYQRDPINGRKILLAELDCEFDFEAIALAQRHLGSCEGEVREVGSFRLIRHFDARRAPSSAAVGTTPPASDSKAGHVTGPADAGPMSAPAAGQTAIDPTDSIGLSAHACSWKERSSACEQVISDNPTHSSLASIGFPRTPLA